MLFTLLIARNVLDTNYLCLKKKTVQGNKYEAKESGRKVVQCCSRLQLRDIANIVGQLPEKSVRNSYSAQGKRSTEAAAICMQKLLLREFNVVDGGGVSC